VGCQVAKASLASLGGEPHLQSSVVCCPSFVVVSSWFLGLKLDAIGTVVERLAYGLSGAVRAIDRNVFSLNEHLRFGCKVSKLAGGAHARVAATIRGPDR